MTTRGRCGKRALPDLKTEGRRRGKGGKKGQGNGDRSLGKFYHWGGVGLFCCGGLCGGLVGGGWGGGGGGVFGLGVCWWVVWVLGVGFLGGGGGGGVGGGGCVGEQTFTEKSIKKNTGGRLPRTN